MSQTLRSQQGAQGGQGDQIKQRSRPGNLRGLQQELVPPGEDLNKPSAQSTELNLNEQQTLDGFTIGGGQATEGHQGARQEQRVASDGSQGVSSNPHIVEPVSRPLKLGDRQGGKTLLAHGRIGEPPIWVNSKQYDCILRYRALKKKKGWDTKTPRPRYRHDSRQNHANRRPRGSGGRLSKKPVEGEVRAKDDDKGHCNGGEETASRQTKLSSRLHGFQHSEEGTMAQDSSPPRENQLYETRPRRSMVAQSAGFNLNQGKNLSKISALGEQILNRELLGSSVRGRFINLPDQITQLSDFDDLLGPQQKMASLGEKRDFYKRASHDAQPTGLKATLGQQGALQRQQRVARGQVAQGHLVALQRALQLQRVARDGSQGFKPDVAKGEAVSEDRPQQKKAPHVKKRFFHTLAFHNAESAELNLDQQQTLGGIAMGGQVAQGHQGARQRQRVGSDGSQGFKPDVAEPMISSPSGGEASCVKV